MPAPNFDPDSGPTLFTPDGTPIVLAAGPNIFKPLPDVAGPYTMFRVDPNTGIIQNYQTYELNPYTGQYVPTLRFRGAGMPHAGVDPPLVLEPAPGKGLGSIPNTARPALPSEIPGGGGGVPLMGNPITHDPFGLSPSRPETLE